MEKVIHKVEEITGKDSWISSIHSSREKADEHISTRRNPCRLYRRASNGVWQGIEDEKRPEDV